MQKTGYVGKSTRTPLLKGKDLLSKTPKQPSKSSRNTNSKSELQDLLFIMFLILTGLVFSIFKLATINSWQISMIKVRDHNPFSHHTKGKIVIQRKLECPRPHRSTRHQGQSSLSALPENTALEPTAHSPHQIHNLSSSSYRNSSTATISNCFKVTGLGREHRV